MLETRITLLLCLVSLWGCGKTKDTDHDAATDADCCNRDGSAQDSSADDSSVLDDADIESDASGDADCCPDAGDEPPTCEPGPLPTGTIAAKWTYALNSRPGARHVSSPAIADINDDGTDDIVIATNYGHILVLTHNSGTNQPQVLWDADVGSLIGQGANSQFFASSPAVADIDNDGKMEIVAGLGPGNPSTATTCIPGGIIVLEHDGTKKFNKVTQIKNTYPPNLNCPDPVFATPALGDIDGDSDLEIVVGGFDMVFYAWHHDGQAVANFPADSAHAVQNPAAPEFQNTLGDTIWSSPALSDLDNDGKADAIFGTDEGDYTTSGAFSGWTSGWSCPYQPPIVAGYCGGSIYALKGNGQLISGFPKYVLEIVQSSPSVWEKPGQAPRIFVGGGWFYFSQSPDKPRYGFGVRGLSANGAYLSGWQGSAGMPGGVVDLPALSSVNSAVPASVALGNVTGDAAPEIVVFNIGDTVGTPSDPPKVYVWNQAGQRVNGFPKVPLNQWGHAFGHMEGQSSLLLDYDCDGKQEILLTNMSFVVIVDDDGTILTNTPSNTTGPVYRADTALSDNQDLIMNSPALGDIDGDGALELVVHNTTVFVWDLPASATYAQWPMFKANAARTSVLRTSD